MYRHVVLGSFHQGSEEFMHPGMQCTAIAAYAICYATQKEPQLWLSSDLNDIVIQGSLFYDSIVKDGNVRMLTANELPSNVNVNGIDINMTVHDSSTLSGVITSPIITKLIDDMINVLNRYSSVLFIFKGYTMALMKLHEKFAVFDSHSRNNCGLPCADGASCLIILDNEDALSQYFTEYVISVNVCNLDQYDITPLSVSRHIETYYNVNLSSCLTNDLGLEQSPCDVMQSCSIIDTDVITQPQREAQKRNIVDKLKNIINVVAKKLKTDVDCNYDLVAQTAIQSEQIPLLGSKNVTNINSNYRAANELSKEGGNIPSSFLSSQQKQEKETIAKLRNVINAVSKKVTKKNNGFELSYMQSESSYTNVNTSNVMSHNQDICHIVQDISKGESSSVGITMRKNVEEKKTRREKVKDNDKLRQKLNLKRRLKYATDSAMREKIKKRERANYKKNAALRPEIKETRNAVRREKYATDAGVRDRKKVQTKIYKKITSLRPETKENYNVSRRAKYATDSATREKIKKRERENYKKIAALRPEIKKARNAVRREKYATDSGVREKIKMTSRINNQNKNYSVIENFKKSCNDAPLYVCTVCERLLFEKGVKPVTNIHTLKEVLGPDAVTGRYIHVCNVECPTPCPKSTSPLAAEWICFTCKRYVEKGQLPPQAVSNNLLLDDVPVELKDLNLLERHIISLIIPFMKIVALPKGGQKGIIGPAICVPVNTDKVSNCLPIFAEAGSLILVKLKKKLSYMGYYCFQKLDVQRVLNALKFLVQYNKLYKNIMLPKNLSAHIEAVMETCVEIEANRDDNVEIDRSLLSSIYVNDITSEEKLISEVANKSNTVLIGNKKPVDNHKLAEEQNEESPNERSFYGLLDTCIQPNDIALEPGNIDEATDAIFSIAPCEGNRPMGFFSVNFAEEKAFPYLFPTGSYGYQHDRKRKMTLGQYFQARVLNADSRFARDSNYLFFAQYTVEHSRITSEMRMALRKSSSSQTGGTTVNLADRKHVDNIIKTDMGYRFLSPIRGSPAYWQRSMHYLFAAVRQLGIPTFFATFSCGDLRWPEIITNIALQQGKVVDFSKLQWNDKCEILKQNPVTAVRMFDDRVQNFISKVIKSAAKPIGTVKDFFYRVEFQARGSAHIHCLFWCEEAKTYGTCSDEEFTDFVDKYTTCRLPDEVKEKQLFDVVTEVQMHSKKHSKSCQKNKTVLCRYGFPRPPAETTFVSSFNKSCAETNDADAIPGDADSELDSQKIEELLAQETLTKIWEALQSIENGSLATLSDILNSLEITHDEYVRCMGITEKKEKIILRRTVNERWINNYNELLLLAWNANMDIQVVLNPYSCICYILSYISKAEHAMSQLLQQTLEQAKEGDLHLKQQMKRVSSTYLSHREVGMPEAIYRVLGLPLQKLTRDKIYIPAHHSSLRMTKPISKIVREADVGEDACMPNIVDRYRSRPKSDAFEHICLVDFSCNYRVVESKDTVSSQNNAKSNRYRLLNGLGTIAKRKNRAIFRLPKYSKHKNPEDYYEVLLTSYLPHRHLSDLKPAKYHSYEEFFLLGYRIPHYDVSSFKKISDIIIENRSQFEPDEILVTLTENANLLEMQRELEEQDADVALENDLEQQVEETLLDNNDSVQMSSVNEKAIDNTVSQALFTIDPALNAFRKIDCSSLNFDQQRILYYIRDWAINKQSQKYPDAKYIFVHGPGGTGKSHLIKCIVSECHKILKKDDENDSAVSIAVLAPTGTAAYNISGQTLHSFFHLPTKFGQCYKAIGENLLNSLRVKMRCLSIIIIDEISMCSVAMLNYVDKRLQQITQSRRPFGNITIVAFGDLYQLRPVKGVPVYGIVEDGNIFLEHFHMATLSKIVRQESEIFCGFLNRIRTAKKNEIQNDDLDIIEALSKKKPPTDALHIFSRNSAVDEYNKDKLESLGNEITNLVAEDYDSKKRYVGPKKKSEGLPDKVLVAKGARVMLIRNIDTSDGLVNGAMGIIIDLVKEVGVTKYIAIKFDDEYIGKTAKFKCRNKNIPPSCVAISRYEEADLNGSGIRLQFPIKLSFACTIHKTQGMTVDELVVSLDGIFSAGMAYVALSRVRDMSGLYITDFNRNKSGIYCDEKVEKYLEAMQALNLTSFELESQADFLLRICLHNVEGLLCHFSAVKNHIIWTKLDIFFAVESWLSLDGTANIDNYVHYSASRNDCCEYFGQNCGGGGIECYVGSHVNHNRLMLSNKVENLVIEVVDCKLLMICAYRSPTFNINKFLAGIESILIHASAINAPNVVVMGDFNENLLGDKSKHIATRMAEHGFVQLITTPTTSSGTLLDVIYYKGDLEHTTVVSRSIHSYHEPILLGFRSEL